MKLNVGCGESHLEGFINIDIDSGEKKGKLDLKPDLIHDITDGKLPYEDESIDTIYFLHSIEHIQLKKWSRVFEEFYRLLKPDGELVMAYPEFGTCAKYFMENFRGMRDFWRNTLYGRQMYPGDFHVVPVVSKHLAEILQQFGFKDIVYVPEEGDPGSTILRCYRGYLLLREDVIAKEVFGVV